MKWIKPNGVEIETNDRPGSIEAAEEAGWEPVKDEEIADQAEADEETDEEIKE